jgi:hypothetical protein
MDVHEMSQALAEAVERVEKGLISNDEIEVDRFSNSR